MANAYVPISKTPVWIVALTHGMGHLKVRAETPEDAYEAADRIQRLDDRTERADRSVRPFRRETYQ